MEAQAPSNWGSSAGPFLKGSSISTPFLIFTFSKALDLAATSRFCFGPFSPRLFQKLEGQFPSKWLSKHSMIIAKLCANGFRPFVQLLGLEEGMYSFCRF